MISMLLLRSIYLIWIADHCLTGAVSLTYSAEANFVNCDEYVDDFDVINRFPFPVLINPEEIVFVTYLRTSPNDNRSVTELYITEEEMVPPSFVCLRNVDQMVIYRTPFKKNIIPDQLVEMKNLLNFLVYHTPIVHVTNLLNTMRQLQMFSCVNCNLTSLPDFSHLHQLWSVDVLGNQLRELRGLENLMMLNIASNQFEEIPSIANKTQTIFLTLSNNPLKSIEPIWSYPNLEGFNVAQIGLTSLPMNIDQLIHLQHIDMSNNKLTYLPRTIFHLKKLETLNIHNNAFSKNELDEIRENVKNYPSQIELTI